MEDKLDMHPPEKSVALNSLDLIDHVNRVDKSDMLSRLVTFGRQCKDAIDIGESSTISIDRKSISTIVVSGLGGSAIGGDLLSGYCVDTVPIPIVVNRTYSLPSYVTSSSLLFLVSYSGNTEEILSVFEAAVKRNVPLVCITSGGQLARQAVEKGKNVITIPTGYPPRTALGYLFFPMLAVLSKNGVLENKALEMRETIGVLERKAEEYHPSKPTDQNMAKQLAARLCNGIPLLYASERFYPVARRWATQIAENSESFAHSHVLPELNHNEIMAWRSLRASESALATVFLRDGLDHPQIQKRIELSKNMMESDGFQVSEVWSEGDSLLARLFSLICLGDFVSFYLAVLKGIDPTPVERIEYLKRQMNNLG